MPIKEEIKGLKSYFIDEKSVRFKLDANESPYDLPAEMKHELAEELAKINVNRYPDPSLKTLRRLVAAKEGVPEDTIIFGNGSDELIYMLFICLEESAAVALPEPGFSMYSIGARTFGKKICPYKLKEPFYEPDETDFEEVMSNNPDLVIVANPNNPTGGCFPWELLKKQLHRENTIFVSDEAYADFSGKTLVPEMRGRNNLLVMKTFSKIGFAAIRLGYLMGPRELIKEIEKVRLPYNINSYSQKLAEYFFKRNGLIKGFVSDIISERERVFEEIKSHGVFVLKSEANFLTFRVEKSGFYDFLLDNGLLVKDLAPSFGMKNFFRYTIGRKEENDYFLKLLREFIGG